MHSIQHRPAFVEAHPHLKALHRAAQCALFAAANAAGLSRDKELMLEGINAAFNRKGSRRLISRKQLKVEEMEALTAAIDAGLFSQDWTWGHDFMIYVRTATVQVPAQTVRLSSMHFEPLGTPRARQWSAASASHVASANEVRAAYEKFATLVNYCIDHPAYETDVVSREIERLKCEWRRLEATAQATA